MSSSNNSNGTSLPLSTSDLKQEVRLRLESEGHASLPPETVLHMLDATVARCGDKPALSQKRVPPGGNASDVSYTLWTWKEYKSMIHDFAKSLLSLGFDKFDTINILGFNAPEWNVAHFGCMAAGGVGAGIYTTNLPEACQYITGHSKAKVVVVEGVKQLEKYYEISKSLPHLKALVMYGMEPLPGDVKIKCPSVPVYTFEDFLKLGASSSVSDADVKARSDAWKPGETCALIYTSTLLLHEVRSSVLSHCPLVISPACWMCSSQSNYSFLQAGRRDRPRPSCSRTTTSRGRAESCSSTPPKAT
jgi:long-chain-fatty-acid--CoA ligase ACSBG